MASFWFVVLVISLSAAPATPQRRASNTYSWTRNIGGVLVTESAYTVRRSRIAIFSSNDPALTSLGVNGVEVLYSFDDDDGIVAVKVLDGPETCFVFDASEVSFRNINRQLRARDGTEVTEDVEMNVNADLPAVGTTDADGMRRKFHGLDYMCPSWQLVQPVLGTAVPEDDQVLLVTMTIFGRLTIAVPTYTGGPPAGSIGPTSGDSDGGLAAFDPSEAESEESEFPSLSDDGFIFSLINFVNSQTPPKPDNVLGDSPFPG